MTPPGSAPSDDKPPAPDWHDIVMRDVAAPRPEEETFFADRRAKGLGVGLSERGDLVYGRDQMNDASKNQPDE